MYFHPPREWRQIGQESSLLSPFETVSADLSARLFNPLQTQPTLDDLFIIQPVPCQCSLLSNQAIKFIESIVFLSHKVFADTKILKLTETYRSDDLDNFSY
jgi:hypothetical protein